MTSNTKGSMPDEIGVVELHVPEMKHHQADAVATGQERLPGYMSRIAACAASRAPEEHEQEECADNARGCEPGHQPLS